MLREGRTPDSARAVAKWNREEAKRCAEKRDRRGKSDREGQQRCEQQAHEMAEIADEMDRLIDEEAARG